MMIAPVFKLAAILKDLYQTGPSQRLALSISAVGCPLALGLWLLLLWPFFGLLFWAIGQIFGNNPLFWSFTLVAVSLIISLNFLRHAISQPLHSATAAAPIEVATCEPTSSEPPPTLPTSVPQLDNHAAPASAAIPAAKRSKGMYDSACEKCEYAHHLAQINPDWNQRQILEAVKKQFIRGMHINTYREWCQSRGKKPLF